MKLVFYALAAASLLPLCACTAAALPTAPTAATPLAMPAVSAMTEGFEPQFFRAFLQNGYESPQRLEPVRVLRGPLRVYLRTHDNDGVAIDRQTLDSTERLLIDTAAIWSGETFGITAVERGSGTRERRAGWITVKWSRVPDADRCGRSTVGIDGGFIEFDSTGRCSCGQSSRVYSRLVRHELGHAMGYYHTDAAGDVMYGQGISPAACNVLPSERERLHAKLAHAAPR